MEHMERDREALAGLGPRVAGTEGERAALHVVRERLGDVPSTIEGFVAHTSPAFTLGAHAAALLAFGLLGAWYPLLGAILCTVAAVSLMGEGTGRFSLVRPLLPKAASYNLVVPHAVDKPLGAVVITTPLDAPSWRPRWSRWVPWARPLQGVVGAALLVVFLLLLRAPEYPWGPRILQLYLGGLGVLVVALALGVVAHRRVDARRADTSGLVALVELERRFAQVALDDVELWLVFTGCGHAFQGGIDAFLRQHAGTLPSTVLVLALDEPGRAPLTAAFSEGSLWAQHHRPTGPALAERLHWAGVSVPAVDLPRTTDARVALLRGYRALALAGSVDAPATAEATWQAVHVAETVSRWFAADLTRVARAEEVACSDC